MRNQSVDAMVGRFALVVLSMLCGSCGSSCDSGPCDRGGCFVDGGPGVMATPDGGPPADGGPCSGPDRDGDGVPDAFEEGVDTDGDGRPDSEDLDSDADGVADSVEAFDTIGCPFLRDCDGDGVPNFRDPDSDDDGATDGEEGTLGLNACAPDSLGDGCYDGARVVFGGCDDIVRVFLDPYTEIVQSVAFHVPADIAAALATAELHIEPVDRRPATPDGILQGWSAAEAEPIDAATLVGDHFENVQPGADIRFDMMFVASSDSVGTYFQWLVLRDDAGIEVARIGMMITINERVLVI